MDAWLWLLAAVVAIPLAWWGIKVATAFAVPISSSGCAYLQQALARRGIDPRQIPDACIHDFVDFAQKTNAVPGRGGAQFRAEVMQTLDTIADLFILWRTRPSDLMFENRAGQKNYYREIFERYGIK